MDPRSLTARRIVRHGTALWLFCSIASAQLDGPVTGWWTADTRAVESVPITDSPRDEPLIAVHPLDVCPSMPSIRASSPANGSGAAPLASHHVYGREPAGRATTPAGAAAGTSELLVSPTAAVGPSVSLARFGLSEPHMGTQVRLVFYAADEARARAAAWAAFDRIAALDRTLSDYQSTSELMRLSARAGEGPIPVSDDLFRVLDAAQAVARRTGGAFDVTSGPLTRLWRRARHLSELPPADRVAAAQALTGYRLLTLDPRARTVTLEKPGMSLDVGGLAKGFAADEAMAVLASHGITRALVALGGDIVVSAPPPDRKGWTIDVTSLDVPGAPRQPSTLVLHDVAVSTAGDAEQWLSVNGVRYSHILDPRTGWPMTIRSSTTVIARRGLEADSLDTAIAVLGPTEGLPLVEATAGAAALLIRQERDGQVTIKRSSRWPES